MNAEQRLLALDAACVACEYPDIPPAIATAIRVLQSEIEQHFDQKYGHLTMEQFLRMQGESVRALTTNPQVFGGGA